MMIVVMQCRRVVRGSQDGNYRRFEACKNLTEAALLGNAQDFHAEWVYAGFAEVAKCSFAVAYDFEPVPVKTTMLVEAVG